jgi:hypothetical protein
MKFITVIDNPYNENSKEVEILIPHYPAGSWGEWLEREKELDSESWGKILQHGILFHGMDDEFGNKLQWGGINKRLSPDDLFLQKEDVPNTNFHGGPVNMLCGSYED